MIVRQQLLESTRKWARSALRAGIHEPVVDEVVAAITAPEVRTPEGDAGARALVVKFAVAYDSGAYLDASHVLAQRSQTWTRWGSKTAGVVVVLLPPVLALIDHLL